MNKSKTLSLFAIALLFIPSVNVAFAVETLDVWTDQSSYELGDDIEIGGITDPYANVSLSIIFNDSLAVLLEADLAADENGTYGIEYSTSQQVLLGIYNVTAVSGVEEASVWFSVVAAPVDDDGDSDGDDDDDDGTTDDDDDGAPDGEGLENAIERARLYLEKVRETLGRLAEEYENNTTVMEYIAKAEEALLEAEQNLDNATVALEEGDTRTAARHLAAARNVMGRLKGFVNSVIKRHKVAKAEKFMKQAQARFQGLRANIESLEGNLTLAGAQKVKNALTQAAGKMNGFKNRLSNEDVNDVLEDLQSLVDEVDDELDDIDGAEVSKALKGANALQARLGVLRQTQARLTLKYGNATQVNGDLEDVEGLLEEIMEKVQSGRPDNAGNVLKEAKKLAQEAQNKYREAVKAQAKRGGKGNQNSKRP